MKERRYLNHRGGSKKRKKDREGGTCELASPNPCELASPNPGGSQGPGLGRRREGQPAGGSPYQMITMKGEGRKEGRKEGKKEGKEERKKGRKEVRKEGRQEGREGGRQSGNSKREAP